MSLSRRVLIVPFMELKFAEFSLSGTAHVLIVPFMELKSFRDAGISASDLGLNRTFYGIEIDCRRSHSCASVCLNRTFYGIEMVSLDSTSPVALSS